MNEEKKKNLLIICLIIIILMLSTLIILLTTGVINPNKNNNEINNNSIGNQIKVENIVENNNQINNIEIKDEKINNTESTKPSSNTTEKPKEHIHIHEFSKATCIEPQKCSCGITKGQPIGHKWQEANCTTPKTCSICNATEGTTTPHKWTEATCTTPKTCTVCNKTEGTPLKHNYNDGFCTICKQEDPNATNPIKSLNTNINYYSIYEINGDTLKANILDFSKNNSNKEVNLHSLFFRSNITPDTHIILNYIITYNEKKYYPTGGNGLLYKYELTDKEIHLDNGYDKITMILNANGTLTVTDSVGECKDAYKVIKNTIFSKLT